MHRAGFNPQETFVVSKPDFLVNGQPYAVGEVYTPTADVGLRTLRQWYDYGWLSHPRPGDAVVQNGTPLHGDGEEPPKAAPPTAPKPGKRSGKIRVQDPVTKKLKWVYPDEVSV